MRFEELLNLTRQAYADALYPAALADDTLRVQWANPPAAELFAQEDSTDAHRPDEPFTPMQKEKILSSIHAGTPFAIHSVSGNAALSFFPMLDGHRLIGCQILSGLDANLPGVPNQQEIRRFTMACEKSNRVPLTIIFSTLGLLSKEMHEPVTRNSYLRLIRQNCYRLLRSSNNIVAALGFAFGMLHPEMQNGNLADFVSSLCDQTAEMLAGIGIPLHYEGPQTPLRTAFDPIWMRRILLNLISNSCKFTRAGNAITLRVEATETTVSVTVADRGMGIPPETLQQFDVPVQIIKMNPSAISSNGLGLTLVHRMVQLQGGKLQIKSMVDEGTEVTLTLPQHRDAHAPEYFAQDGARYLRDRFSDLYVELSDVCDAPAL